MRLDTVNDCHQTPTAVNLQFSDQIIVLENGISREIEYRSRLEYRAEQNFAESVLLKTHFLPVRYRSTVKVSLFVMDQEENQEEKDQLSNLGEVNHDEIKLENDNDREEFQIDDNYLVFYEEIYLLPKFVVKSFASTVYSYPKETKNTFKTVFNYNVNSKEKLYVTGLTYPAVIDLGFDFAQLHSVNYCESDALPDDDLCDGRFKKNGFTNGNSDFEGQQSQCQFISTKELTFIKGIAVTCL